MLQSLTAYKACKSCRAIKRLSEYSKNRNNSDGHTQRCKDCERKRVQAYEEAKRSQKTLADTKYKKCRRCGKHRRLRYFYPVGDGDYRRNTCVDCMKIKRSNKNKLQVVYFLQLEPNGPIKIGYSSSLENRLSQIQTCYFKEIVLLGVIDGNQETEKKLHRKFKKDHLRGEWFKRSQEILDFINQKACGWVDGKMDFYPDRPLVEMQVFDETPNDSPVMLSTVKLASR